MKASLSREMLSVAEYKGGNMRPVLAFEFDSVFIVALNQIRAAYASENGRLRLFDHDL